MPWGWECGTCLGCPFHPPAQSPLTSPPLLQFLDEPLSAATGWSCQQVGQWLESLNLEQYVGEFAAREVDGQQLLHLDGAKLKVGCARNP